MSLEDIYDQPVPLRFIENMIERDRIPNGLLFHGPSGVGKRLLAMEMAKMLWSFRSKNRELSTSKPSTK